MINYFKQHKWKILISSLVTLTPIIAGIILWDKLPDLVPSHWNVNGEVDGWVSKPVFVFVVPLLMVALNLVASFATAADPKHVNHEGKPLLLVYGVIPAITIILSAVVYCSALGVTLSVVNLVIAILGVLFLFIGNYLPKCKQNYTIGIKIMWTLHSERNWVATHRFAGKVWVVGAVIMILASLLPMNFLLAVSLPVTFAMVIVPIAYSYIYYRNHQSDEGYFDKGENHD